MYKTHFALQYSLLPLAYHYTRAAFIHEAGQWYECYVQPVKLHPRERLGQCSCVFATRAESRGSTRNRQEVTRSRYWTIRRCYVLSPVLLLLPLRSALSASSLWNKIYLLLLSLGFVTGAKEEESENVCCLVVEKASKHRREANGQYNIIFSVVVIQSFYDDSLFFSFPYVRAIQCCWIATFLS